MKRGKKVTRGTIEERENGGTAKTKRQMKSGKTETQASRGIVLHGLSAKAAVH